MGAWVVFVPGQVSVQARGREKDPWGRPYDFHFDGGSFRLMGSNPDGKPDSELTIVRRLSATQRLVLEGAPRDP